jgi:hypothetical protein
MHACVHGDGSLRAANVPPEKGRIASFVNAVVSFVNAAASFVNAAASFVNAVVSFVNAATSRARDHDIRESDSATGRQNLLTISSQHDPEYLLSLSLSIPTHSNATQRNEGKPKRNATATARLDSKN